MASSSPSDVHVLLVDDDRVCRTLVAGMLKKCSYQGESRVAFKHRRDARASTMKKHVTSLHRSTWFFHRARPLGPRRPRTPPNHPPDL
jgi:uncharacterized protein (UPF0548 family)